MHALTSFRYQNNVEEKKNKQMDFIVARQEDWIVERINDCINMNAAYKMLWVELKGELSMRCYTDYCVNVFFLHKTRFYQVSFQIKR